MATSDSLQSPPLAVSSHVLLAVFSFAPSIFVEKLTRSAGSKPVRFEFDGINRLILTASSISAHVLLGQLLGLRPTGHQSRSLPQPALSSESPMRSRPPF